MSTIRNPVGPQPPNVYWRRRLLLLIGVVAVIVVILLIVFAPKGDSKAATDKTPTPTATSTPPNPDPKFSSSGTAAAAAGTCDPSVVTITPITDASSYAANAQPQLSMSIVNASAKACSLDVGTKAQQYLITSGADTIWNSTACQQDPTSDVRTLEPGKTLTTTPFAWNRTRSSESGCAANPTAVTGGGASYHLQVKLGNITSKGTKQFILN
ncbi:hypothetical protein [Pseudolysinimonas sp.]|uniref:hypothetical protein n=1 Tax=Pseudolysinimonas sp. TaxID=2680009 RepID=UPI003F7DF948